MNGECILGRVDRKQSQKWPHKALTRKDREPFCGQGSGLLRAPAVSNGRSGFALSLGLNPLKSGIALPAPRQGCLRAVLTQGPDLESVGASVAGAQHEGWERARLLLTQMSGGRRSSSDTVFVASVPP